ncbi:MAG: hypothetical protein V3T14_04020 [Myxococcota bacterium]
MIRTVYIASFAGLAIFYYYFLGAGPTPSEIGELEWFRPRGWALRLESMEGLKALAQSEGSSRYIPVLLFSVPPLAFLAAGLKLFRGAVARLLVLSLGSLLMAFPFYGLLSPGIWRFFSWRWPAVTASMTLVLSTLVLAPALLRSALRLPGWGRNTVLGLVALAVYLVSVEITGTNWRLRANISPWPVVTLFGFLLFGYVAAAIHASIGLGAVASARLTGTRAPAVGILVATVLSGLASFVVFDDAGLRGAIGFALLGTLGAGVVLLPAPANEFRYRGWTQVGAGALAFLLIFLSDQAVDRDLRIGRNEVAPVVLDALEVFKADNDEYPDNLEDLVPKYLAEIPRPRIGLIRHEGEEFLYTNLGDSYVLEFACGKWIQCAYNPPFSNLWGGADPNLADPNQLSAVPDVAAGEAEEEPLEGAWSCDSTPPKLW